MKKSLILALSLTVALLSGACGKDKPDESVEQEAVVLVNTALYPLPDAKNAKPNGWPKRLERVWVTATQTTNEMYPVMLADKSTKGFIPANHLFLGEKKIATFQKQTDWHLQPDAQSHKLQNPIPRGTKALIVIEQDGWVKVNLGLNWEGWAKAGSYELGDVELKKPEEEVFEVNVDGVKVKVRASSWLADAAGYSYTPDMAFDGKLETSWQEGKDDAGHGEWIEIEFPSKESWVVSLINGFAHTDQQFGDLYTLNSRVKRVKVFLDGSETDEVDLLDENRDFQTVINGELEYKTLRLVITDTYSGSKWQDTSISEIAFE